MRQSGDSRHGVVGLASLAQGWAIEGEITQQGDGLGSARMQEHPADLVANAFAGHALRILCFMADGVGGAAVSCLAPDGREVARGLVNYSSSEARRIAGHGTQDIEALLGYIDSAELIHRDNLILL